MNNGLIGVLLMGAGFVAIMFGGIVMLTLNRHRTGLAVYIVGIIAWAALLVHAYGVFDTVLLD